MNLRKTLGSLVLVSSISVAASSAYADPSPGERLDDALDQTGERLNDGADKTGDALEDTLDKTGDALSGNGDRSYSNNGFADRLRDAADRARDRADERRDRMEENRERFADRFDRLDFMERMDRSTERRGLLGGRR
jgi:hypothetical protein